MTTLTRLEIPGLSRAADIALVTTNLRDVPGARQLTTQVRDSGEAVVSILSSGNLNSEALEEAVNIAGFKVAKMQIIDDALAQAMADQAPSRQAARSKSPS